MRLINTGNPKPPNVIEIQGNNPVSRKYYTKDVTKNEETINIDNNKDSDIPLPILPNTHL